MRKVLLCILCIMLLSACSAPLQGQDIHAEETMQLSAAGSSEETSAVPTSTPIPGVRQMSNEELRALLNDSSDEWSETSPNTDEATIYPSRLLYPSRHDDVHQEDSGFMRVTTFTSDDSPEQILAWYREQMATPDWQDRSKLGESSLKYFFVANGLGHPGFSMALNVVASDHKTLVTLTYRISGPFSPEGWPKD